MNCFVCQAKNSDDSRFCSKCTIYEINEDDGKSCITLEYVKGKSLEELIKETLLWSDRCLEPVK